MCGRAASRPGRVTVLCPLPFRGPRLSIAARGRFPRGRHRLTTGPPYPRWVDDFCEFAKLPSLKNQPLEVETLAAWCLLGAAPWTESKGTLPSNLLSIFLLPELGIVFRRLMAALLSERPDLPEKAATSGPEWLCSEVRRRVEAVDWGRLETFRRRLLIRPTKGPSRVVPIDQRRQKATRGLGSPTWLTRKRGRVADTRGRVQLIFSKGGGRLHVTSQGEPDFAYYLLRRGVFPAHASLCSGATLSVPLKNGEAIVLLGHVGALGTSGRLNSLPAVYVIPRP